MNTIFVDLKKAYELFIWLREARKITTPEPVSVALPPELWRVYNSMLRRDRFRRSVGTKHPEISLDELIEKLYA